MNCNQYLYPLTILKILSLYREFLVFLYKERLLVLSSCENDVETKLSGCHGDGDDESRVCTLLRLRNAHILVPDSLCYAGIIFTI